PDFLSPMLVKDLRQGMRGRYFVFVFLGLQIVMFFVLSSQLSALDEGTFSPAASSGLFWTMIGIAVLLLFPMSGFSAVANERKAQTLELLQLTGLTSRAIVWGKWQSLASQILLLMTSIFPWAVLRYLLGGIELWQELQILALLTSLGLALSAVAVGLSTTISPGLRILIIVGGFLGLQFLAGFGGALLASGGFGVGRGWGLPSFWDYVLMVLLAFVAAAMVMEHGASRIAPPVESYAGSVRLLGWVAFVPFILALIFQMPSAPAGLSAISFIPAGRSASTMSSLQWLCLWDWQQCLICRWIYGSREVCSLWDRFSCRSCWRCG
ncbi:MAG: hypothetical protein SNJ52_04265, partial [Verrucomicrobiia bacterium]